MHSLYVRISMLLLVSIQGSLHCKQEASFYNFCGSSFYNLILLSLQKQGWSGEYVYADIHRSLQELLSKNNLLSDYCTFSALAHLVMLSWWWKVLHLCHIHFWLCIHLHKVPCSCSIFIFVLCICPCIAGCHEGHKYCTLEQKML